MSSKTFHWKTRQNVRNAKAARWTKEFVEEERNDRENRALYVHMPSPKGSQWMNYIKHRVKMMKNGIGAYGTKKYTRLALDKHIETERNIDKFAHHITGGGQPSLVFLGADGDVPPNSPIRIKKHVRCPGTRKLVKALRKCKCCHVIMVDEWGTSQTCPRCLERFKNQPKSARFKKCRCIPDARTLLPEIIVSRFGKKLTSTIRQMQRETMNEALIAREDLESKVKVYFKKWHLNQEGNLQMHRDIVGAKNIMLKGKGID